ncbi:pyridine nucleotide-disulfide oxidoreductase [Wolbachia endosymbiont of Armadillidium vulgare str. wVulC]|uniref:FAD-dependent oxidoreductase n=1 Tax=Wolbachia endosymbiont of Armadillidium vulgare TaxID=77039 RepID=UPI00064A8AB2|nr:NAD-binding protein [Wolbachia endosymbiont of Armadillidium vulgare]KLT22890.1 pyridine nucleotide-disulfide oxidoreductase [Wolbachia endosymbiont of Armadillidium vulgare str. wVulC]OJH31636.1 Kynurenine 3-monooxygenase [Wolbachia endosymbiont of Armadillidium vulgare]OJH32045.1 Kynurenine 3-monooxygenase [Wolbachia endosymbiont of Armadillidium vulgare]OJH32602.1 Kynurenine 3-monooxygenase [Wolbachia endosymbiont of Armadillidium vulgare]OJH33224.1 Kynurenine 3-monooxygenase [Wolbachia 
MSNVGHVVIVGSGPVGSFMAVLTSRLGVKVTVYEKREEFTREINVKIDNGFFKKVQQIFDRLEIDSKFFEELNKDLKKSGNKIVIKNLEKKFKEEALSTGNVEYKMEKVKSFEEVDEKHKDENPIILDCTGSNSMLRTNKFGSNRDNMVTIPLQHAMYINLKAKNGKPTALHQVMKNIGDIKLADIVASKHESEVTDVTIPVFISNELAKTFDQNYPNINTNPLYPFQASNQVPDKILYPISSIISTLILKDWEVDLNSVVVKKIEINCGYAKKRSEDHYICLGDAAVNLAFFRSLNFGLEYALKFFMKLSSCYGKIEIHDLSKKETEEIKGQFRQDNPHLNPVEVHKAYGRNSYLVVTKVNRYGCFYYNATSRKTEKLTGFFGAEHKQISRELDKLNKRLDNWKYVLQEFELERDRGIKNEIKGNKHKNIRYNFLAKLISKFTVSSAVAGESIKERVYVRPLYKKNYEFFSNCFEIIKKENISGANVDKQKTIDLVAKLLNKYKESQKEVESKTLLGKTRNFFLKYIKKIKEFIISIFSDNALKKDKLLNQLANICAEDTSPVEKINAINELTKITEPFIKKDVELHFIVNLISNNILKQSGATGLMNEESALTQSQTPEQEKTALKTPEKKERTKSQSVVGTVIDNVKDSNTLQNPYKTHY